MTGASRTSAVLSDAVRMAWWNARSASSSGRPSLAATRICSRAARGALGCVDGGKVNGTAFEDQPKLQDLPKDRAIVGQPEGEEAGDRAGAQVFDVCALAVAHSDEPGCHQPLERLADDQGLTWKIRPSSCSGGRRSPGPSASATM
jgi:hypothetical protein